jgi:hypothetical protein
MADRKLARSTAVIQLATCQVYGLTLLWCGLRSYKCAVVLCDMSWLDPDMEVANGIAATEQSDMLRLDAMILMVQLNIRKLVEVRAVQCEICQPTPGIGRHSPMR